MRFTSVPHQERVEIMENGGSCRRPPRGLPHDVLRELDETMRLQRQSGMTLCLGAEYSGRMELTTRFARSPGSLVTSADEIEGRPFRTRSTGCHSRPGPAHPHGRRMPNQLFLLWQISYANLS
jgi:hypothetical protein